MNVLLTGLSDPSFFLRFSAETKGTQSRPRPKTLFVPNDHFVSRSFLISIPLLSSLPDVLFFSLPEQNTLTDFASVRSQQDLRGRLASLSFSESGVGRKGLPKGTPRAAGGESKAEGGGQAAGMQACSGSLGTTHAGEQRGAKSVPTPLFGVSTLAT